MTSRFKHQTYIFNLTRCEMNIKSNCLSENNVISFWICERLNDSFDYFIFLGLLPLEIVKIIYVELQKINFESRSIRKWFVIRYNINNFMSRLLFKVYMRLPNFPNHIFVKMQLRVRINSLTKEKIWYETYPKCGWRITP